jgi:uncharacterized protein
MSSSRNKSIDLDVLIVGAGPAGLFAALSCAAAGMTNVTVIDAGPDVEDRRRASDLSRQVGWGHPDYERGVGGAGLFSDGKLCLSLDVGGHLEQSLDARERAGLEAQIEAVFGALVAGPLSPRIAAEEDLSRLRSQASAQGLNFKHYPVAHIGTDRCGDVIVLLRRLLEDAGVRFQARTELVGIGMDPTGGKVAQVNIAGQRHKIRARQVVLAMGKVGAARQARLCEELGAKIQSQPIYVGARFETDARKLEPLFEVTKDPKYNLLLENGAKVKTHCASEQGEVISLSYEGLPLAGGHNYFDARTSRSGFSILWNGFDHGGDALAAAEAIMRRAQGLGDGNLVAQRLVDYRGGRASRAEDLAGLSLSCPASVGGNIREILPAGYFTAMDELLTRLEGLVPGFVDETAVAYAPAIEWWMRRVDVDDRFLLRTAPGVAACGDGSGWSQGIVHAAATGLLAARGLHGGAVDVGEWLTAAPARPSAYA